MSIRVRKAKPGDLQTVQDLNQKLFLYDHPRDPKLNLEWSHAPVGKDYFESRISGKDGVCFVAETDGQVIGYIAGSVSGSLPSWRPLKRGEVENMFLEEPYRGQGTGKLLMQKLLQWFKSQNVTKVFVQAYWGNDNAIEFYKANGFKPYFLELEIDS